MSIVLNTPDPVPNNNTKTIDKQERDKLELLDVAMALNIEFNGQSKRVRVTPGTTMVPMTSTRSCLAFKRLSLLTHRSLRSSRSSKTRVRSSSSQTRGSTSSCTASGQWTSRSHFASLASRTTRCSRSKRSRARAPQATACRSKCACASSLQTASACSRRSQVTRRSRAS